METQLTTEEFRRLWPSILIDASDEFDIPPEVIRIGDTVIGTLGNFSASTGKGKSKKSFNVSAIVASALTGKKVLNYECSFPEGKRRVLYFDTEQSDFHCLKITRRINRLAGYPIKQKCKMMKFASLRKFGPVRRREIIEKALDDYPDAGLVVIDGLRDLLFDINSSNESAEVIGMLMRWTNEYNVHIHTVLHLNKGDDNVRGHIGTELNNKAETILQITRCESNWDISEVKAYLIRDKLFAPFAFKISDEGIPVLVDKFEASQQSKRIMFSPELMAEDLHRKALDVTFLKKLETYTKKAEEETETETDTESETDTEAASLNETVAEIRLEIDFDSITEDDLETEPIKYTALLKRLQYGYFVAIGITRQRNSQINLLKFLMKNGMVRKKGIGYVYNRDFHYVPPTEF